MDLLIPDENGTVPYDDTIRAKLYSMGYTYDPKRAKVKVIGFTGWKNPQLCYAATTRAIKQRHNPTDVIVILGSKAWNKKPMHVILVDKDDQVVFDNNEGSNLEGNYIPGDGYFYKKDGKRLYDDLYRVTVKEFLNKTQGAVEATMNPNQVEQKIEIAKVDEQVMQDTLKSLYLIMYYVFTDTKDLKITPSIKKRAVGWEANLKKFLATFKIPNDDFVALLKAARTAAKYTTDLATKPPVIGNMLFKAKDKFTGDNTIQARELKQLELFGRYFRTDNEKTGIKLLQLASNVKDPELLAMIALDKTENVTTKGTDQKKLYQTMMQLSKKFLGKELHTLTKEQKAAFKKKAPEAFKQHRDARKAWLAAPQNFLRTTVRNSGKKTIDYEAFLNSLKKNHFSHAFPQGFVGRIDEDGNFYTSAELQLETNPKSHVTMNPKYIPSEDNTYPCSAFKPKAKSPSKIYTLQWVTIKRPEKKYKTLETVKSEGIQDVRARWLKDLMGNVKRKPYHAARLEMIYSFGARPGTKGNKSADKSTGADVSTYGICTLLVKHVKKQGNDYIIQYLGKGTTGMDWRISPSKSKYSKRLAEIIEKLMKDKGPEDDLWTDDKGKVIPVQATLNYAKDEILHNPDGKLYTFRYMAADKVARAELAKFKPKAKTKDALQKEADDFFENAMLKVGAELKHHTHQQVTGNTATKNYVNPELIYKFFFQHGLRITNKNIPKVHAETYKAWLNEVEKEKKGKK